MSLSRRFLNLIVDTCIPGVRTLRRLDLTRHQFFFQELPLPPNGNGYAANVAFEMERIRLPRPSITFRASALDDQWGIHCFPLADGKVLCADQSGRTFLFDADTRHVVTMPCLHKPKVAPYSLFIPSSSANASSDSNSDMESDPEDYIEDVVGRLYVMEGNPEKEPICEQPSEQFQAYIYGQRRETSFKAWDCQLLPPPPYVRDPSKQCPLVTSYAVVGDGSHIVVSAEGAGTYLMDTVKHTWEEMGNWMLPFYGKVEYVPELKLWFGLSPKGHLAVADLSSMDCRPRLLGNWKEFNPPEEWQEVQEPQLVNLGSGRFCIARFFQTVKAARFSYYEDELIDREFAVFTGVEVVPHVNGNGHNKASNNGNGSSGSDNGEGNGCGSDKGNGNCNGNHKGSGSINSNGGKGKVKLQMITHMSRCHISANGTTVESVF